jgi:glutaredoxin
MNTLKKISALFVVLVAYLFFPVVALAAETTTTIVNPTITADTGVVTTQDTVVTDPAQIKYIIYTTTTCAHCKKVKAFVSSNSVPNIEFRNVDIDATNLEEFKALYTKYNIMDESKRGVPVMENNGQLISGDAPIIEFLTNTFGIVPKEADTTLKTSSSDWVFIGFGGLVILLVVGYGAYSVINKK